MPIDERMVQRQPVTYTKCTYIANDSDIHVAQFTGDKTDASQKLKFVIYNSRLPKVL